MKCLKPFRKPSSSVVLECFKLTNQLNKLKEDMILEEKRVQTFNTGIFFLSFKSTHEVQHALKHSKSFLSDLQLNALP